ncbi:unnamed protein product [Arctia plantaginis]|uniref:Uncharacterized protein n=1 Tax=Arctia plantaginis TaxID=874455 RepID=A0A8S1BGW3_ARCPL|nr:unnamed protein product [Arctia plantaginis]
MKKVLFFKTRRNDHDVSQIVLLLLVLPAVMRAQNTLGCPDLIQTNKCSCYTHEDGLFLDCQDTDPKDIKNALKSVSDIHSLSVYNLDDSEESLGPHFIPQGVCIKHIHMSRTSIKDIGDDMFMPLRRCLETLSIVSSKIKTIPQKALSGLLKLMSIDFTSNYIEEIPSYSFYGLPLMKLDVKGNVIHDISESAFSSLELTLSEINLSENNLTTFPIEAFAKLRHLRSLRLSWNEMSSFPIIVKNLDLSYNRISQLKTSNFRGLTKLRTLCLSNNNIESMESFTEELSNLKLLDLAHNKLQNILNEDLINLKELTVLYLSHNNIKYISVTAFRSLNKIIQIDLDHNKLQSIPIELLTSVENHIQEISIKGNVILCSCKKDNAWVWIQDHPKIMKSNAVICYNDEYPQEKCDVPVISQLSVDKHKDNSVSVSWFIRNRTAIKALQILYYGEDGNYDVKSKYLEKSDVSVHIRDLEPNFNYTVCVIALSEDPVDYEDEIVSEVNNTIDDSSNSTARITQDMAAAILIRSSSNECVLFNTFREPSVVKTKPIKKFAISSLLNRRMGLIVGCSLGFVVFFIMVSVLLYTKIKERKRIAKSDPAWSEMNDYHSMASKDDILQNSITASTDNILLGMAKNRKQSIDHLN